MQPETIPDWIKELTDDNLLVVYDVVLDVRQEMQLTSDVAIALCPSVIKFSQLMPFDGVNMRDRYSEMRWKTVGLLKSKGIISGYEYLEAGHRWESKIRITAKADEFNRFSRLLDQEIKNRNAMTPSDLPATSLSIDLLENIILRFHSVVIQLRKRHDNRATLDVSDEYDVQDLLRAILQIHFDDIRPEVWTPSYAGKSSRVDFLLKNEKTVVEIKKTRVNLGSKEIGDQLIIDTARYSKMQDCEVLVCFVYDPENRITNPRELEVDLSGEKESISVTVIVVPKMY